jgi:hypothetical protein
MFVVEHMPEAVGTEEDEVVYFYLALREFDCYVILLS